MVLIDSPMGVLGETRLRNEPVQARSAARLAALLDAAAQVIDEVGYERLTTAMVAERAGASIGTVYRYFPDRLAVLEGLANRALARFLARIAERFDEMGPLTITERVQTIVDTLVEFHRDEPGYRVLRFGDAVEARVSGGLETTETALARSLGDILRGLDPQLASDELVFRLTMALAICEVLVHRAFVSDPQGDERTIDEAKIVAGDYLELHLSSSN
jgi:AcrR family transcriptional regulator